MKNICICLVFLDDIKDVTISVLNQSAASQPPLT